MTANAAFAADAPAPPEVHQLTEDGYRHLEKGDYAGALERYRAAYARFPSAKILLNIGTSLLNLGRKAEAADVYEKYLRDPDANPDRKGEVQAILARLDAELARLRIEVTPADARVTVDALPVEGLPARVRVGAGHHVVQAEKDGLARVEEVDVDRGKEATVRLELRAPTAQATQPPARKAQPPAAPPRAPAAPLAVTSAPAVLPPPAVAASPARADERRPFYKTWWFWTAVAAAAAGGVLVGVLASGAPDDCQGVRPCGVVH